MTAQRWKTMTALALVLAVAGLLGFSPSAGAKSAQEQLQEIRSQHSNLTSKIARLKKEKRSISQEVIVIDKQSAALDENLADLEYQLSLKRGDLGALEARLKELEDEISHHKELVEQRVVTIYMQGELTYLDLLFSARDFRDFVNRGFYLNLIFQKDQQLYEELREKKEEKLEHKAKVESKIAEIAQAQHEMQAERMRVQRLRTDKAALIRAIGRDQSLAERKMRELEEESRRIQEEIRRKQGAYTGTPWRGRFIRPVPGRISSGYGWRTHPITRRRQFHTGVDIAASYGTPVRAGGDGRVIFTGWRGGYGNVVIIDHGDKVTTIYAHLSSIRVSEGTVVKAGQVIGRVGSTGFSTGPHLHFEVRVDGKHVDPFSRL